MKKQYKALMLDLDGTVIAKSLTEMPTKRVHDAIVRIKDRIHISVVTGRNFESTLPVLTHLNLVSPAIILGGALIIDPTTQKIHYKRSIQKYDIVFITKIFQEMDIKFYIDKEYTSFAYNEESTLEDVISAYATDLTEEQVDTIQQKLLQKSSLVSHKFIAWKANTFGITISHPEGTKQHGIYEVAKLLGIGTHEIIGVGDGYNDFPLLMACGLKVAMGNAVPELKAIADYIAPTVDEDGVADVIEKFILD